MLSELTSMLLLLLLAACVAWLGSLWLTRYAVRLKLLQSPNPRSSHNEPMPHAGGITIIFAFLLSALLVCLYYGSTGTEKTALALGLLIGAVGLLDDIRSLPALPRLGIQLAACAALLLVTGLFSPLLLIFLLFLGVWWINLFNFMDGIDGIASSQAVFMLIAGALLALHFDPHVTMFTTWWWMLALAAATFGFLLHNWPPAKIFMGDVGSTFLAFMVFALALFSTLEGWLDLSTWLILAAVFITDTTVTLLRRLAQREKVMQAHRRHAYQHLARRWQSHRRVTLTAALVNLVWLAPLAYASLAYPEMQWHITSAAYLPVILVIFFAGAGKHETA